jgi:molybdate transport system substrate-binding protein
MSLTRRAAVAGLAAGAGLGAMRVSTEAPLVVLAEPALHDPLMTAGWVFAARTLQPINYTFAASTALAAQIDKGAAADVLIALEATAMADLARRGLIGARRKLYADRLAVIAPAASKVRLRVDTGMKLAAALGTGRLALASAEASEGRWSRAALAQLKTWDAVKDHLAVADSGAAVVAMVAAGHAALGIVFASEAKAERRVRVVDLFPLSSHAPIIYAGAVTAVSKNAHAREFLDALTAEPMAAAFRRFDSP